ncbi:phosphotransferase [Arthrobacter sp. MP_M4]|uniref:phosphotransferase n=1 Tax=Arthrobacter sp. MP_M4 TaxID=3071714 RepID=UPI003FA3481F
MGSTVRKPWTEATPNVLAFMTAVRAAGVDVPAALGQDTQGRQVTEFIPGRLALDSAPLTHAELGRVGAMVRAIHDASEAFTPDPWGGVDHGDSQPRRRANLPQRPRPVEPHHR